MRTTPLGALEISLVGLGCNNFGRVDADRTAQVVDAAIEHGVTFFDTADVYNDGLSEEYLGRALKGRRDQVVLATKFGYKQIDPNLTSGDPRWIAVAVRESLRRLQTDHIDLYQHHGPDPEVPVEETLGALQELVDQGLVREVGGSNLDEELLRRSHQVAADQHAAPFRTVQNQYSLLHREPETSGVLAASAELGAGFLPYFPLESGLLTGKYRREQPTPEGARLTVREPTFVGRFLDDARLDVVEDLIAFTEARGRTLLELAFSWLAARPAVISIIAGATRPEQVAANAAACSWELTSEELEEVDRLTAPVTGRTGA